MGWGYEAAFGDCIEFNKSARKLLTTRLSHSGHFQLGGTAKSLRKQLSDLGPISEDRVLQVWRGTATVTPAAPEVVESDNQIGEAGEEARLAEEKAAEARMVKVSRMMLGGGVRGRVAPSQPTVESSAVMEEAQFAEEAQLAAGEEADG